MAPVLSLSIDSIMACPNICDLYTREMFVTQWAGETSHTLEWFVNPPEHLRPIVPDRDKLWMFVAHMSRRKRLKFGLFIMQKVESLHPNAVVFDALALLKEFLEGNATVDAVIARREVIEAYLHDHLDDRTSKKYLMIDATRQLMNKKGSMKSVMRLCRHLENWHPKATYQRFVLLAVKILKEEI